MKTIPYTSTAPKSRQVSLMPDLKRALDYLDKKTLLQLSQHLGFKGWSVLSKDEIVRRLVRQSAMPPHELLSLLSISTLKVLCRGLGVNPGATSKQVLIGRILGRQADKILPVSILRKKDKNRAYACS